MKRAVLVSGCSCGIGAACLAYFKARNWFTVGVDRYEDVDSTADFFVTADISTRSGIDYLFEQISTKGIVLSSLINNAATQIEKSLLETTDDEWDFVLDTNLKSVFMMIKSCASLMPDLSSVINISSVHARATSIGLSAYVASKGGVSALTRAAALELADRGIRVNAILPGAIDTPMLEQGLSRNGNADLARANLTTSTPLKRIGRTDEVAGLAFFLTDDLASQNITGQEFICDGGVLARLASE